MRRSAVALLALLAFPPSAMAAPVLILGHSGRASRTSDAYVSGPSLIPAPTARPLRPAARPPRPGARPPRAGAAWRYDPRRRKPTGRPAVTVRSELTRLYRRGAITAAAYGRYSASFARALRTEHRLGGTRRAELAAVTQTLHQLAVAHALTPTRLPALFATLDRNRQWWRSGPLLAPYQRVEFAGSQLVWEYYPGQGIQLQVLGSFGKANGLYQAGPAHYAAMEQLLAELIPLAAHRGSGLAWEYYFAFDGGAPPWTSAMSQATGLEALAHAYLATRNPSYLTVASKALPLFSSRPPVGVRVQTTVGSRYLQYTFAPRVSIINAFLQSLIGLDTYAQVSGDPTAAKLFAAGNAEAQTELPSFDTGAWSLYQPGVEDDLSYHELVTGFLQKLCRMTNAAAYCTMAQRFTADLKTPPVLKQLTATGARKRRPFALRFRLSKRSRVGVVITQGTRTRFLTSADFSYGVNSFTVPGLRAGSYGVRLAATDLAGNFARITGTLRVPR